MKVQMYVCALSFTTEALSYTSFEGMNKKTASGKDAVCVSAP